MKKYALSIYVFKINLVLREIGFIFLINFWKMKLNYVKNKKLNYVLKKILNLKLT